MSIGRTDAEAETPILWPPDAKRWLIGKDPGAWKDWGQEEKGTTEDEMVGWHHWLYGHEFGWTLDVGDGQRGLACCSSWGRKELDTTERLNWTEAYRKPDQCWAWSLWVNKYYLFVTCKHKSHDLLSPDIDIVGTFSSIDFKTVVSCSSSYFFPSSF